jgi:hypothetical protein
MACQKAVVKLEFQKCGPAHPKHDEAVADSSGHLGFTAESLLIMDRKVENFKMEFCRSVCFAACSSTDSDQIFKIARTFFVRSRILIPTVQWGGSFPRVVCDIHCDLLPRGIRGHPRRQRGWRGPRCGDGGECAAQGRTRPRRRAHRFWFVGRFVGETILSHLSN